MIKIGALIVLVVAAALVQAVEPAEHSYIPENGFIPDKATAVAVAVAVLSSIYGELQIRSQAPHTATLNNGVWTVAGTLRPGFKGGVAEIEISKKTGQILRLSHGK